MYDNRVVFLMYKLARRCNTQKRILYEYLWREMNPREESYE
jgi:hypothetical protein